MHMTKKEFANIIAERCGVSKAKAEEMVNAYHDTVLGALKNGENIVFTGFGKWNVKRMEARTVSVGGVKRDVPAKNYVRFTPAGGVHDELN